LRPHGKNLLGLYGSGYFHNGENTHVADRLNYILDKQAALSSSQLTVGQKPVQSFLPQLEHFKFYFS